MPIGTKQKKKTLYRNQHYSQLYQNVRHLLRAEEKIDRILIYFLVKVNSEEQVFSVSSRH